MRLSAGLLFALFLSSTGCALQAATAPAPQKSPATPRVDGDGSRKSGAAAAPPTAKPPPSSNVAALRGAGREHLQAGRLDAAIQTLESAYRAAPGDTEASRLLCEAYNQRAIARYSDDNLEAAIADLRRSLDLDPSQSEIRIQLARAQARLHRLNAIGTEGEPKE